MTRAFVCCGTCGTGASLPRATPACAWGGGEHLLALDADDRLEPTFLAETLRTMRGDGAHNAVFTDFLAFGVRRGRIPFQVRDVVTLLKEQWIPGSGTLFRRSLWDGTGGLL